MTYAVWKFLHVLGALGFVAAHGASGAAAFRLRKEREPARIQALLALSASTRPLMYVSLLLLVATGVITGYEGDWWQSAWIWWSIGLLVLLVVVAIPLAVPYYGRIRRAVAARLEGSGPSDEELDALLGSPRPLVIAGVETVGVVVIVFLMVLKPG